MGNYEGSNSGQIIVNVDEIPSGFCGAAYLTDDAAGLPGTVTRFEATNEERSFSLNAAVFPIDPNTATPSSWDAIRTLYASDVRFPAFAEIHGQWTETSLTLSWKTDIGTYGHCVLFRPSEVGVSQIAAERMNWLDFKKYIAECAEKKLLFRGQREPWSLRTSFHRHGRADLSRFLDEDIPLLQRNLSARTRHVFDLTVPDQNGAFLNLAQHHGYPTPLLDWTYSPYVAAFFAYRGLSNHAAAKTLEADCVRIYVFDQSKWRANLPQIQRLLIPTPHFSIMEFMAIDNDRMIPQQAASSVTNVENIEAYICSKESTGTKYLSAVDLPKRDRREVVRELQYMGVTAGSLFPGLDGACEDLKERRFET